MAGLVACLLTVWVSADLGIVGLGLVLCGLAVIGLIALGIRLPNRQTA